MAKERLTTQTCDIGLLRPRAACQPRVPPQRHGVDDEGGAGGADAGADPGAALHAAAHAARGGHAARQVLPGRLGGHLILSGDTPRKSLYVVARNFFLLLLNCPAWPCLGPA